MMTQKHQGIRLLASILMLLSAASLRAAILKGPYLQNVGMDCITIMWESDLPGEGLVRYDTHRSLAQSIRTHGIPFHVRPQRTGPSGPGSTDIKTFYRFEVRIAGLRTDTLYYYQLAGPNAQSGISTFRTAPPPGTPFRFVVYGDNRTYPDIHARVAAAILDNHPGLIIHSGDFVSRGHVYAQWGPQFFTPMQAVIDHIPFYAAKGNHENAGPYFRHFFSFPDDELNYSFDYGAAHFVALNSNIPPSQQMLDWLEHDLAASKARWKFVYHHHPTFNAGGHKSRWGRGTLPRLYGKYGVDVVFSGHSHLYERTHPLRSSLHKQEKPVTYIVSGGGGANLYPMGEEIYIAKAFRRHHFCVVDLQRDTCAIRVLSPESEVLDALYLQKDGQGNFQEAYMASVMSREMANLSESIRNDLTVAPLPAMEQLRQGVAASHRFQRLPFPEEAVLAIRALPADDVQWRISPASQEVSVPAGGSAEITIHYHLVDADAILGKIRDRRRARDAVMRSLKMEVSLKTKLGDCTFVVTPLWEGGLRHKRNSGGRGMQRQKQ